MVGVIQRLRLAILDVLDGLDFRPTLVLRLLRGPVDGGRIAAGSQHRDQMVGRHQCVAKRDVDALPADWRHGMRSVPNEQQPGRGPLGEPSAHHIQQLGAGSGLPVGAQMVGQVGRQLADHLLQPPLRAVGSQRGEAALGDDEADLKLSVRRGVSQGNAVRRDLDQRGRPVGITVGVGNLEPEDVEALRHEEFW